MRQVGEVGEVGDASGMAAWDALEHSAVVKAKWNPSTMVSSGWQ